MGYMTNQKMDKLNEMLKRMKLAEDKSITYEAIGKRFGLSANTISLQMRKAGIYRGKRRKPSSS
jgi:hypothetical protein